MFSVLFLVILAKADWTWIGGSQTKDQLHLFQNLFVESADNSPGGVSDTGYIYNNGFVYIYDAMYVGSDLLSKLVRYNATSQKWAGFFVQTSPVAEYGVINVFSEVVQPPARAHSAIFYDTKQESLFVFGGVYEFGAVDNSLFEFSFTSMMWRWIHGSSSENHPGSFGTLGVESISNIPPSRGVAAYFYDQINRKAYVYGGVDYQSEDRADLWVYNVESNTWVWIHGSQQINSPGYYGETGLGTAETRPGARARASFGYDETRRRFYLYGGEGTAEGSIVGCPTDLWQYEQDRNIWTFLVGNRDSALRSNYGTRGVTTEETFPRSRIGGSMAIDHNAKKLYVFGGRHDPSVLNSYLNDLWVLDLDSLLWTWIAGANSLNAPGRYGTKGQSSPLNNPPARSYSVLVYLNETRQIFLYGGHKAGTFSDQWMYSVPELSQAQTTSFTSSSTARTSSRREQGATRLSVSGEIVGIFVTVPLVIVGIIALIITFVRSRRLKEQALMEKQTNSSSSTSVTAMTRTKMDSTTGNITLVPTSLGIALPAHLMVNELDFRSGELLASGGGGDVFNGEAISTELVSRARFIVVKRPKITNDTSLKLFEQEISIMYLLSSSQFVAKIVGFSAKPPILLMKMYVDGSLMSFAEKFALNVKWKLRFSLDVARGLLDIHKAQIAHCDMKPQNILVEKYKQGRHFCVITDFGIAQVLSERLIVVKYSQAISVRGLSVKYAAPEVFLRFRNSLESSEPKIMKASDVYALSVSIYFIICRNEAWRNL